MSMWPKSHISKHRCKMVALCWHSVLIRGQPSEQVAVSSTNRSVSLKYNHNRYQELLTRLFSTQLIRLRWLIHTTNYSPRLTTCQYIGIMIMYWEANIYIICVIYSFDVRLETIENESYKFANYPFRYIAIVLIGLRVINLKNYLVALLDYC